MQTRKLWTAGWTALVLTFATSLPLVAQAAEKRDQSYVKTNFRTLYKTALPVGDVPNHEILQEANIADIKYSPNSDFKIKEEWVYSQSDLVDGNGNQSGYFYDTHEDGSHTYGAFKGTVKTTSGQDGSWATVWEGTYQFLGGSGKFKNLKGGGKYKGQASSQDHSGHEEGSETVEY
ncbi:MAG TPA: hypothetical protein VFB54_12700 [Burkholderiales bacterium]|nr:hypothetical protein [Burkholderiales bacterium]